MRKYVPAHTVFACDSCGNSMAEVCGAEGYDLIVRSDDFPEFPTIRDDRRCVGLDLCAHCKSLIMKAIRETMDLAKTLSDSR